jgi:hypothetical protein
VKIECLIPAAVRDLDEIVAQVGKAPGRRPFAPELIDFTSDFAAALSRDKEARQHPELMALAFWMRRAETLDLARSFGERGGEQIVRAPRGVVFHVPPANVDVMFVYSWLLSLLCGNRNIVRLSRTRGAATEILLRVIRERIAGATAEGNLFLTYGHEDAINTALSGACDTRVIWGGDQSVQRFRGYRLAPLATELVFPDRFSYNVLRAAAVLEAGEGAIQELAEAFYNDAFWFHQLACSSPALVIWCGTETNCAAAGDRLFSQLARVVGAKGYRLPPSARMARFTFECASAMELGLIGRRDFGPAMATVRLEKLASFDRRHTGGGFFFEYYAADLSELAVFAARKDQTLGHFGFSHEELTQLALELNGRGVDRIVPIGRALRFGRFWDGMDLLAELTRCVWLEA